MAPVRNKPVQRRGATAPQAPSRISVRIGCTRVPGPPNFKRREKVKKPAKK